MHKSWRKITSSARAQFAHPWSSHHQLNPPAHVTARHHFLTQILILFFSITAKVTWENAICLRSPHVYIFRIHWTLFPADEDADFLVNWTRKIIVPFLITIAWFFIHSIVGSGVLMKTKQCSKVCTMSRLIKNHGYTVTRKCNSFCCMCTLPK